MSSSHLPFLSKMFPCLAGQQLSPDDEHSSAPHRKNSRPPKSVLETRERASRLTAEAYVPTWQRSSSESGTAPVTGRRKAASPSAGSASVAPAPRARSESEAGSMLYFGDGSSSHRNTYTPRARATSTGNAGSAGNTGSAPGLGAGRDASGYLRTGISDSNPMNATYANLTYGGSLQYNFAGTQSFGAGM